VSLTAKDVAQITRLLEESSFDELYLELDGLKLSLRRGSGANVLPLVDPASVGTAAAGAATAAAAAAPAPAEAAPAPAGAAPAPAGAAPAPAGAAPAPAGHAAPGAGQAAQPASAGSLQVTLSTAPTDADARRDPNALTNPNTLTVSAPLLGTFYRAPKPGAPPFVEVGSRVKEDTIVGIIEVMKLMNTVRAGIPGKVVEILARDGALVEYGEALMRVSKTS
jgi:acetyl-CoA carboxylase biotin carboxyl carrier protein